MYCKQNGCSNVPELNCKQYNVFECDNFNCPCRDIHDDCQKGNSKRVIKKVISKISNTPSPVQTINLLIDKKIDELSQLRQNLTKFFENSQKCIDMSELEKKFYKLVTGEGKIEEFTSWESKKLWESSCLISQPQNNKILAKINTYLIYFDQSQTQNVENLKKYISSLFLVEYKEKEIRSLQTKIRKNSAICTTDQLIERLIKILGRKIKKMSYMFRASENQFSIKRYFEVCGQMENTLIICKTNGDKIIGGFTPLAHDYENEYKFAEDVLGQSFIFSLTDQERFVLRNKKGAIHRSEDKSYICFGNAQFQIGDESNLQNDTCSSYVNDHYYCPAYYGNEEDAWLKFTGNQSQNFTTKEWQVWKVQF